MTASGDCAITASLESIYRESHPIGSGRRWNHASNIQVKPSPPARYAGRVHVEPCTTPPLTRRRSAFQVMLTPEQLNELPNSIIRARIAATVGRTADPEPSGLEPLAPFITMHLLYRIREGLAHLLQEQRSGWSLVESVARLVADVTGAPCGIPHRACKGGKAEWAGNYMVRDSTRWWAARKKIMHNRPGERRDKLLRCLEQELFHCEFGCTPSSGVATAAVNAAIAATAPVPEELHTPDDRVRRSIAAIATATVTTPTVHVPRVRGVPYASQPTVFYHQPPPGFVTMSDEHWKANQAQLLELRAAKRSCTESDRLRAKAVLDAMVTEATAADMERELRAEIAAAEARGEASASARELKAKQRAEAAVASAVALKAKAKVEAAKAKAAEGATVIMQGHLCTALKETAEAVQARHLSHLILSSSGPVPFRPILPLPPSPFHPIPYRRVCVSRRSLRRLWSGGWIRSCPTYAMTSKLSWKPR